MTLETLKNLYNRPEILQTLRKIHLFHSSHKRDIEDLVLLTDRQSRLSQ